MARRLSAIFLFCVLLIVGGCTQEGIENPIAPALPSVGGPSTISVADAPVAMPFIDEPGDGNVSGTCHVRRGNGACLNGSMSASGLTETSVVFKLVLVAGGEAPKIVDVSNGRARWSAGKVSFGICGSPGGTIRCEVYAWNGGPLGALLAKTDNFAAP